MTTKNATAPTANRGESKPAGQRGNSVSYSTTKKPTGTTFLEHALADRVSGLFFERIGR